MSMTRDEFLSALKSRGAFIAPPATTTEITHTNLALQHLRAAILPMFIIELYAIYLVQMNLIMDHAHRPQIS